VHHTVQKGGQEGGGTGVTRHPQYMYPATSELQRCRHACCSCSGPLKTASGDV
jgi:hypothetical protein